MNPNRRFKNEIYEQFSRIGKAVSSPKRLELLDILCQGERTVEKLAHEKLMDGVKIAKKPFMKKTYSTS